MDHEGAIRTNAAERYMLGELSRNDKDHFEDHFFSCRVCAEDVRDSAAFLENARSVLREAPAESSGVHVRKESSGGWMRWLQPHVLAPSFAAAALAVFAGYQQLVTIPALRTARVPLATSLTTVTSGVRSGGAGAVVRTGRGEEFVPVMLEVNNYRGTDQLEVKLLKEGTEALSTTTPAAPNILLNLPAGRLTTGKYEIIVRNLSGSEEPERFAIEVAR